VAIFCCDLLCYCSISHTYHKKIHRWRRGFHTQRRLRLFYIWNCLISLCLAYGPCKSRPNDMVGLLLSSICQQYCHVLDHPWFFCCLWWRLKFLQQLVKTTFQIWFISTPRKTTQLYIIDDKPTKHSATQCKGTRTNTLLCPFYTTVIFLVLH